jgi:hypothetical protein
MTCRLPCHARTLQDLMRLKELLERPSQTAMGGFRILEVLWPREQGPSEDGSAERLAQSLGARVIPVPTEAPRLLDLLHFLPEIHGDYVWILPGCTHVSPLVSMNLPRVKRSFDGQPKCAVYTDNAGSFIYRVSALRAVAADASGTKDVHALLKAAGFTAVADSSPAAALCELEEEYGGKGMG